MWCFQPANGEVVKNITQVKWLPGVWGVYLLSVCIWTTSLSPSLTNSPSPFPSSPPIFLPFLSHSVSLSPRSLFSSFPIVLHQPYLSIPPSISRCLSYSLCLFSPSLSFLFLSYVIVPFISLTPVPFPQSLHFLPYSLLLRLPPALPPHLHRPSRKRSSLGQPTSPLPLSLALHSFTPLIHSTTTVQPHLSPLHSTLSLSSVTTRTVLTPLWSEECL